MNQIYRMLISSFNSIYSHAKPNKHNKFNKYLAIKRLEYQSSVGSIWLHTAFIKK